MAHPGDQYVDRQRDILQCIEWHRVILDESHTIKNANTSASRSIRSLRARNRWCLTGTPFGRHISDIENQLRFIGFEQKDVAMLNLRDISKRKIFENGTDNLIGKTVAIPLINVMQKVVMRHKKEQQFDGVDIVKMPEKEESVIYVEFTDRQRAYYEKLYATAKERYEYYKTIQSVGRGAISVLASLHPARRACSGSICFHVTTHSTY